MNLLNYVIILPIITGTICLLLKRWAGWLALIAGLVVLLEAWLIFSGGEMSSQVMGLSAGPLNSAIFLAVAFISLLVTLYSFGYLSGKPRLGNYYSYTMLTLGAAAAVLFATDYITLLIFWGIIGVTLYLLVGLGDQGLGRAAQKTLIIVGGADALMIIGVGIIWFLTKTLLIAPFPLPLNSWLTIIPFACLAIGAFAKAGLIPFHGWIPEAAEQAPLPVMAFLPASLDKLLGIYLLFRLTTDIFNLAPNSAVAITLLALGSFTIVAGVLAALVQHDFKKLLAFHAISQVGYMVVGIGSGLPIGLAGGLFHMFNNAIYKSVLFFVSGSVERRAKTTELENLGGLAKAMPLTFAAFLVAALAISGIPPFNGFFSKWLIYQAIVDLSQFGPYWLIWLTAAMIGSAFTLASFMKITHAVFLGEGSAITAKIKEVNWSMWLPPALLALLCLVFGICAFILPLPYLILPSIGEVGITGGWQPLLATGLFVIGLLAGLALYGLGRQKSKVVETRPIFIGGEEPLGEEGRVSGVDFYDSVENWSWLKILYQLGARQCFDLYNYCSRLCFGIYKTLSFLHNGQLHTYLAWVFLGGILFLVLLRF